MKLFARLGAVLLAALFLAPLSSFADTPGDHPAYLRAMSDLRAARWLIEHHPSSWSQGVDEVEAVRQIDEALHDLREAAFDDGKDANFHPQIDERPDQPGRLHQAAE